MKAKVLRDFLFLFLIFSLSVSSAETIRAGAYDNPPKIYMDENGKLAGFWYEITVAIAEKENWDLKWVYGTWDECLRRLENGDIDIMTDTGVTPARKQKYSFNNETVYLSWTKLYRNKNAVIQSILDLENMRIGGLRNSFDLEGPDGLKRLLRDFQINATVAELESYKDIFSYLELGSIDAGLVDKDFGSDNEKYYSIESTPVILQPARMQYALRKNNPDADKIIERLDRRLSELKSDKKSVYYSALDALFNKSSFQKNIFPVWLRSLMLIIISALIVLAFFMLILKREIKKKTLSLIKSEENLRITLESIGDGVISTDISGNIVNMNKTSLELTGWKLEEAMGKPLSEIFRIVNADTRQEVINPAELVIAKGKTVGLANHTVLIARDGREFQIADSAAPIRDQSGNIHGVIMVFSDVTEKYNAEEKRIASESSFRKIVESAPFGIYVYELTSAGSLVFSGYNPAADRIIGTDHGRFLGKTIEEAFPMLAVTDIPEMYKKVAAEGVNWTTDSFPYDHKGIKGCFNIVAFGIEKNRMAVMFYDVSDIKAAQEEIKILNEKLSRKVVERTKELELSNRELESFAYSVSHDLRAPLRHINGFARSMEQICSNCGKEALEYLNKISSSALDMGALIDDLLEYSKTGRADLNRKAVNIQDILKDLKEKLLCEEKYSKASIEYNDLPAVVFCDENLIRTVWLNLIENALKYSSKTPNPEIMIGCKDKGDCFEFFVRDNGAGFDMNYSDKLFGVFYRLHGKSEYEGTGIGLANVRRIVERHGGAVRGESEGEGKGACFYFTLPKTGE